MEGRLPATGGSSSTIGPRLVVAKPAVFMNESGGPVAGLLNFFRVPIERLIVAHDELDLPFTEVRIKRGGGEAGHNGLRSISRSVGSKEYWRIRMGVGRPPGRMDPADYVLSDVPSRDRVELQLMVSEAVDLVHTAIASDKA